MGRKGVGREEGSRERQVNEGWERREWGGRKGVREK